MNNSGKDKMILETAKYLLYLAKAIDEAMESEQEDEHLLDNLQEHWEANSGPNIMVSILEHYVRTVRKETIQ